MTTYTAYVTTEIGEWLTEHGSLRANGARVTHTGYGIVTFDDRAMGILEDLRDDEDASITSDAPWGMRMWVEGDPYPVVSDEGSEGDVLARTILALPAMADVARVVTCRSLVNVAKSVLSAIADATVTDLTIWHRGSGGYATVADLIGVSESTINKAVSDHRRRS